MDFDQDGRLDLVFGRSSAAFRDSPFGVHWFRGVSDGTFDEGREFELAGDASRRLTHFRQLAFGDLNGDGHVDIVRDGDPFTIHYGGLAGFAREPERLEFRGRRPVLMDFDGDGGLDLIKIDSSGHVAMHKNDGTPTRPEFRAEPIQLVDRKAQSLFVVDWDLDGFSDLGVCSRRKTLLAGYPEGLAQEDRARLAAAHATLEKLEAQLDALTKESPLRYTKEQWARRHARRKALHEAMREPRALVKRFELRERAAQSTVQWDWEVWIYVRKR